MMKSGKHLIYIHNILHSSSELNKHALDTLKISREKRAGGGGGGGGCSLFYSLAYGNFKYDPRSLFLIIGHFPAGRVTL